MRRIFTALAFLLAFAASTAFSAIPVVTGKYWHTGNFASNGFSYVQSAVFTGSLQGPESIAACNAMPDVVAANGTPLNIFYSAGGGGCFVAGQGALAVADVVNYCPANSTRTGATCTCESGYMEQGNQCVPEQPTCTAGTPAAFSVHALWVLPRGPGDIAEQRELESLASAASICEGGCTYNYDPDSSINGGANTDPMTYWEANAPIGKWVPGFKIYGYQATGSNCSQGLGDDQVNPDSVKPDDPTDGQNKAPNDPLSCSSKGGYWGQVNGEPTCVQKAPDTGVGGAPKPTTGTQSGNPTDTRNPPAATNNAGGGGQGGASGGSGIGPGSGTGSGGSGGGAGGSGSGGGKAGSGPEGQVTCKDTNTCDDTVAGGSLPSRPKLYEPKFPDGPSGVWSTKSAELKQAPVISMASTLMPTVDSGSAPVFTFDMNMPGLGDFGTYQLGPDSNVWAILRAIVICSAVIMAFRLIFGGA